MAQNFLKSLVAVIAGNILYYFVFLPILPMSGRHKPFSLDLGLVIDAWICLVIYGLIEFLVRRKGRKSRTV